MADKSDTPPKKWGGMRPGAGRKPSKTTPKKPIPAKVSESCRVDIKDMAKQHQVSQAKVVESAIILLKRTPHDVRIELLSGKKSR